MQDLTDRAALCEMHSSEASKRANLAFGIPSVLFIILSIACLIMSIFGILDKLEDADFEARLEPI